MQAFQVTGSFQMGRQKTRFQIETADESAEDARERVLSNVGSKHRVPRDRIEIHDVEAVDADDVEDPVIRKRLEEA